MPSLVRTGILLIAYILGSIPFGFILVKATTGKDVRKIESGRTGGTNTMRASGFTLGFITSLLDMLKSAGAVWIAQYFIPDGYWLHVFAGLFSVLGHNFSIFLLEKDPENIYSQGWSALKNRIRRIRLPINGKLIVAREA